MGASKGRILLITTLGPDRSGLSGPREALDHPSPVWKLLVTSSGAKLDQLVLSILHSVRTHPLWTVPHLV